MKTHLSLLSLFAFTWMFCGFIQSEKAWSQEAHANGAQNLWNKTALLEAAKEMLGPIVSPPHSELTRPLTPFTHENHHRIQDIVWAPSHGRECHRHKRGRVCDGPRKVPIQTQSEIDACASLGITDFTAHEAVRTYAAPEAWVSAVRSHFNSASGDPVAFDESLLWPVPDGKLWRGFGRHRRIIAKRRNGKLTLRLGRNKRLHKGVDIGAPTGSAILATRDGLVLYSNNKMSGYGNALVLLHADGSMTLYAHCSAIYYAQGAFVKRGDYVADVGATGQALGSHLHFELRHGRPINPSPLFVKPTENSEGDLTQQLPEEIQPDPNHEGTHEDGDALE